MIAKILKIISSNPEAVSVFKKSLISSNLFEKILGLISSVSLFIIIIKSLYKNYVRLCKIITLIIKLL